MLWPALIVCRVLKTRWPVSEAVSAISIVSRSRISPIKIVFGAWRNAARSPVAKSEKSLPEFPLAESRPAVRMHELDRVLQRYDMHVLRLVQLVQERGERGRLAAAGAAGHENDAELLLHDLVERSAASLTTPASARSIAACA